MTLPFKGMDPKVKERGPRKEIRKVDKTAMKRGRLKRRACGICGQPATNSHHVLARGAPYFGDDVEENLVSLCGSGTEGCHGDVEHERAAARKALGHHLVDERPDVIEYVREKLGRVPADDWLRRRLYVSAKALKAVG